MFDEEKFKPNLKYAQDGEYRPAFKKIDFHGKSALLVYPQHDYN